MSKIEQVDQSINCITGCSKESHGCANCYAEIMSARLKSMGQIKYQNVTSGRKWNGVIEYFPEVLNTPRKRKKPTMYFLNSMSDTFHNDVSMSQLNDMWQMMADTPQHTYQLYTKRAENLPDRVGAMVKKYGVLNNVWIGISVENQKYALERIPYLTDFEAKVKFLSCEPLLGEIDLLEFEYARFFTYYRKIGINVVDWVIVGGESGTKSRPMDAKWVYKLKEDCKSLNILFFFKQWGGKDKKKNGRLLGGKIYDNMPEVNK